MKGLPKHVHAAMTEDVNRAVEWAAGGDDPSNTLARTIQGWRELAEYIEDEEEKAATIDFLEYAPRRVDETRRYIRTERAHRRDKTSRVIRWTTIIDMIGVLGLALPLLFEMMPGVGLVVFFAGFCLQRYAVVHRIQAIYRRDRQ